MCSPKRNRILPPKCDFGNKEKVITVSHIAKRLEEKSFLVGSQLRLGRDLLHLDFLLIVARWLPQLQTSLLPELHSVAEMKRKGVLCITSWLSWRKISPKNHLEALPSNPFEQKKRITSQTTDAKRISGFSAFAERGKLCQQVNRRRNSCG